MTPGKISSQPAARVRPLSNTARSGDWPVLHRLHQAAKESQLFFLDEQPAASRSDDQPRQQPPTDMVGDAEQRVNLQCGETE